MNTAVRLVFCIVVLSGAGFPLIGPLDAFADSQEERASGFVAGKADASESFGDIEGAFLMVIGAASITAVFVIVFFAGALERQNLERIQRLESAGAGALAADDRFVTAGDKSV